jgi:hypothetical protein
MVRLSTGTEVVVASLLGTDAASWCGGRLVGTVASICGQCVSFTSVEEGRHTVATGCGAVWPPSVEEGHCTVVTGRGAVWSPSGDIAEGCTAA